MKRFRRLSNHFSAVRLISLAKLKMAAEVAFRDQNGPYIIAQEGYDPADATMSAAEYLLGRSGTWLATRWFVRMPVEERRREFVFPTLTEVMELMESLTSEVRVIRVKPEGVAEEGPADEELEHLIRARES